MELKLDDLKANQSRTHYADMAEVLAACGDAQGGTSWQTGRDTFNHFPNWAAMRHAIEHGSPVDADLAKTASARILDSVAGSMGLREAYNPAVTGQFFDIGLVCSGEPECWLQPTEEESAGSKVVRISMNTFVSGGVDKETIRKRGALVCAAVQALQMAGKSVEVIYGGRCTRGSGAFFECTAVLKAATAPLDIDSIAFWLCNPDSLRRVMFRLMELAPRRCAQAIGAYKDGPYGTPDNEWAPEADIRFLGELYHADWTEAGALRQMRALLKSQGVELS